MSLVMQDLGELGFGGLVTLTEWWDSKRIKDGSITNKEILKKAGFYTYLVIGLGATLATAFGWWSRQGRWMEHIAHGFIYDVPRQTVNMVTALKTTTPIGGEPEAVKFAREALARKQRELAGNKGGLALNPGSEEARSGATAGMRASVLEI